MYTFYSPSACRFALPLSLLMLSGLPVSYLQRVAWEEYQRAQQRLARTSEH
jgi:hypothetical protein